MALQTGDINRAIEFALEKIKEGKHIQVNRRTYGKDGSRGHTPIEYEVYTY